jgi:hypothetical protein
VVQLEQKVPRRGRQASHSLKGIPQDLEMLSGSCGPPSKEGRNCDKRVAIRLLVLETQESFTVLRQFGRHLYEDSRLLVGPQKHPLPRLVYQKAMDNSQHIRRRYSSF